LFSLLLFTTLLVLLLLVEAGMRWVLATIPLLMLLWVNLHGGWLIGLGTLGLWAVAESASSARRWSDRFRLGLFVVTAFAITAVNPYRWRLWIFLRETVGLQRTDITEWLPVYELGPEIAALWGLIAVVAIGSMIVSLRRPRLSHAAIVCMLGVASLRVGRLIGFFALSVTLLLSPYIAAAWDRRVRSARRSHVPINRFAAGFGIAIAAAVIAASTVRMYDNLTCVRMEDAWSPEPAATAFIDANGLHGRMLTWFDWGEYAIWHFAPRIKVSMDGRRETVYSDDVRAQHLGFFFNVPANRGYAAALNVDYIWLPKWLPIVSSLTSDGWRRVFIGTRSIIFATPGSAIDEAAQTYGDPEITGCFPGP
jgi:hypothetical protein